MSEVLLFLLLLAVAVSLYWVVMPSRWQRLYLLGISIGVIAAIQASYAAYFLVNIFLVHWASRMMQCNSRIRKSLFVGTLGWLIGNLLFFKYIAAVIAGLSIVYYGFPAHTMATMRTLLLPLGISYITFRQLHYVIEVYREKIADVSLVDYALYILFFPTFLAGPVERFPHFGPQIPSDKTFALSEMNRGLIRIVTGVVKKFILADTLAMYFIPLLNHPQDHARAAVILGVYGQALWIYFDFSGYADMAIGTARLFGYTILENFHWPYLQKNIALYWRNWNISIYTFIRDYFYFPLFGYRASNLKMYAGIFASMIAFNLWHKCTPSFFVLGLYHGFGMTVWYVFQKVKGKYTVIKTMADTPFADTLSVAATFSFVSFGFIFFNRPITGSLGIVRYLAGLG